MGQILGQVPSLTGLALLTAGVFGDPCTVHPDCADAIANSACLGGVCECDYGFYRDLGDTVCTKSQYLAH